MFNESYYISLIETSPAHSS